MFTENIDPVIYNGVETVDRKDLITKGIGTVILSWTDDERQLQTNKLNIVIYYTKSPVNILIATALD